MFTLTAAQHDRLIACRAAWEEGEDEERLERLRQREEDAETLRAIALLLEETRFLEGSPLSHAQMTRLLILVRALAPNPNLDSRLLRQPGEPEALNQDLHALLSEAEPVAGRLRSFLLRRHTGGQTALQFLCAVYPTQWPLSTQAGLRLLELTPEQQQQALETARLRFFATDAETNSEAADADKAGMVQAVPGDQRQKLPDRDPILRLLAEVVIYQAVQEALPGTDYLEIHRLLTQGMTGQVRRRSRQALARLQYASRNRESASAVQVKEERYREEAPDSARYSPADEHNTARTESGKRSGPAFAPPDTSGVSSLDVVADIERFVAAQGFTYPPLAVRSYYLSLQTKPYVFLVGHNGIGKTRLTALFAEALTAKPGEQYRLLPVRPDWADSTPLLGYVNLLAGGGEGRFVSTPFLDFLRRADQPENAHRPHFMCLDEMNLARVEHYFAEILSAMETPDRELLLPDQRRIRLPANLFLTGTLNSDEATYSLSRKVLDRASILAFSEVNLRDAEQEIAAAVPAQERLPADIRQAVFLYHRVTTAAAARVRLARLSPPGEDLTAQIVYALADANDILQPHGFHFAYRVRDETLCFVANSFTDDGQGLLMPEAPDNYQANLRTALDLQLLQKALPRLSGTREQLETPLRELLRYTERRGFARTARKLNRMHTRLLRDGFVRFDDV